MSLPDLIRRMGEEGATPGLIALVVEFMQAEDRTRKDAARDRKRRQRADVTECPVTSRDNAGQDGTSRDPSPLPPSPQTPQPPTHPSGDISTRARAEPKRDDRADALAFGRFWEAYPRKVAKPEAAKAYAKALRRIEGPDPPGVILTGLKAHLPVWADTEPELVPHPSTWLNQDRFNDRPTPRQPRLIHDRDRSHIDRRSAALAERLSDIGAAGQAAARAWRPPGSP